MKLPLALPTLALLAGASFWGVVWYPYRLLNQAGIDGLWATLFTYGLALVVGIALFPRHARAALRVTPVGSSRVDLQACKLEYSIVSPK